MARQLVRIQVKYMAWLPLRPETVVGDCYTIGEVLGSGGFGITYAAIDLTSGTPVAIKEYFPRTSATRVGEHVYISDQSYADVFDHNLMRFWEEALHLNRFNHPHIVKFIHRFFENGTAYIVLEYIEGDNLETWCRLAQDRPSPEQIEPFAAALLNAMEVIHRNHLLHRDIAPKNILLRDGLPVLIDFGSARELEPNKPMTALISPNYAPWEQYLLTGSHQGAWTDIYGASATFYRVLTGRPPVDAMTRSVDDSEYRSIAKELAGVYRQSFLDAIDWGLSFGPTMRPQSVAQWRQQLLGGAATSVVDDGHSLPSFSIPEKRTVIERMRHIFRYNG